MCELSSYRREDFQAVQPKKGNPSFDVLQADAGYSRGHQFASAFLIQYNFPHSFWLILEMRSVLINHMHEFLLITIHRASGLGAHGIDAKVQLPYTYIDIGEDSFFSQVI